MLSIHRRFGFFQVVPTHPTELAGEFILLYVVWIYVNCAKYCIFIMCEIGSTLGHFAGKRKKVLILYITVTTSENTCLMIPGISSSRKTSCFSGYSISWKQ